MVAQPSNRTIPAQRVRGFGTTIFSEMSALALEHQAINLGQGFPDFDGPEVVKQAAIEAISRGINQYAPGIGDRRLRHAIAEHVARFYGRAVDPGGEITVTAGATEAIFAAMQGLLDPGDEVVLFEPFYDSYVPAITMAGGVPRYVPLHPPHWDFDPEALRAAFGPRTKAVLLNTPHNPTGKVFGQEELVLIGELCQEHDAVIISDEVYEHLTYDGVRHLSPADLPGLAERTMTISSVAKSFSLTGWKVGWAIAPPPLTTALRRAHQFITFCAAAPLQRAASVALKLPDGYFQNLAADYQRKRDYLVRALQEAGFRVSPPKGTYFVMADIRPLGFEDDVAFCRYLTAEVGVAAIPPSFFYSEAHKALGKPLVRFAFCKRLETLQAAAERLRRISR
ncbi:MAG: aminotransferase class I/II-fold pyridoxal phosphate-dependent enzyme [Chloroflexi bacterium]|nr:MAG: aminotransferase class I/II-fold pyridoxal phosphate-dependent enzyme [Chloroflexota bacterium]